MEGPSLVRTHAPRTGSWFAAALMTTDLRSIGLFRVTLALVLLWHGWGRWQIFRDLCTNQGPITADFLPTVDEIPRWTSPLVWLESTRWGIPLFAGATVVVYLSLLLGWRSRLMAVLSLLAFSAMAHRNPFLLIGADEVLASMLLWAPLLPLGSRFSVDAWRQAPHPEPTGSRTTEPTPDAFASLAVLGVFVQIGVIYLATAWLKSGPSWWAEGTALARVLAMDTFRRPGAALFESLPEPLLAVAARGVLVLEYLIPAMILSPWGQPWGRRTAIVSIVALHGGISIAMDAGIFSPTMMALTPLLLSGSDWTLFDRMRRKSHIASSVDVVPSRRPRWWSEAVAGWLLAGLTLMNWNYAFGPRSWRFHCFPLEAPWRFAAASQRWHMFGPDAPAFDLQMHVMLRDVDDVATLTWSSLTDRSATAVEPGRDSFVWKVFMLRAAQLTQADRREEGQELRERICRFFADDAVRRGVVLATELDAAELWVTAVPTDRRRAEDGTVVSRLARYVVPKEERPEPELSENQEPTETASTR